MDIFVEEIGIKRALDREIYPLEDLGARSVGSSPPASFGHRVYGSTWVDLVNQVDPGPGPDPKKRVPPYIEVMMGDHPSSKTPTTKGNPPPITQNKVSISQFSHKAMLLTVGLIAFFRDRGAVLTPECLSQIG
ncbi:hypothetical protein IEQ34_007261 [Dendrobium chrysotoxum]|uniref:Uncharacterized protein n=1 Tax=Dendrobium chrysotoxum TaxID=161865 RepID=A0AAV7GRK9_DENCH|nr:hypothetical protein IEQ34_007261 [Dendrobium chrysotoxum]